MVLCVPALNQCREINNDLYLESIAVSGSPAADIVTAIRAGGALAFLVDNLDATLAEMAGAERINQGMLRMHVDESDPSRLDA